MCSMRFSNTAIQWGSASYVYAHITVNEIADYTMPHKKYSVMQYGTIVKRLFTKMQKNWDITVAKLGTRKNPPEKLRRKYWIMQCRSDYGACHVKIGTWGVSVSFLFLTCSIRVGDSVVGHIPLPRAQARVFRINFEGFEGLCFWEDICATT